MIVAPAQPVDDRIECPRCHHKWDDSEEYAPPFIGAMLALLATIATMVWVVMTLTEWFSRPIPTTLFAVLRSQWEWLKHLRIG